MTLDELYKKLELTDDCLIRLSDPEWKSKVSFPSRIYRLLETNNLLKQLDAFFCFDNKPLILFFKNPQDKQALHKAIWNFNESPIAIIVSDDVVEIFNGFSINKTTGYLYEIAKEDKLNDFSYFELVTGKTWEKYKADISHRNRVDYKLLENIDSVQKKLINLGLNQKVANALIGKIIFIRYLIDRKVQLHFQDTPKLWTNEDLCELLQEKEQYIQFVKYLEDSEKGFNGDLFRITSDDYETISQEALNVIILLLQGVEIKTGQLSLFKLYDFSILPVEFISNVYEKFIGKDNQNEEGAYYTPTFLVDYIIQQTIGKHFESTHSYDCKVLDPACGSGIFLVESLRRIIDKYIKENNVREEERDSDDFREVLKNLVWNNIYGTAYECPINTFRPFVRYALSTTARSSSVKKRLNVSLPPPSNVVPGETLPSRPAAEAVGVKSRVRSVLDTPIIILGGRYFPLPEEKALLIPTKAWKNESPSRR